MNGQRHGSSLEKGSSVLYTCNVGYHLIGEKFITCLNNAEWRDPAPLCVTEGSSHFVIMFHWLEGNCRVLERDAGAMRNIDKGGEGA